MVRVPQRVRDVAEHRLRVLGAERPVLAQSVAHRSAGHVLHDDRDGAITDLLDRLGADDVRMAQVGDRSCLSCESLQRVRVIQVPCADSLDRHERSRCRGVSRGTQPPSTLPELPDELVLILECVKVNREIGLGLHRLAIELPPINAGCVPVHPA